MIETTICKFLERQNREIVVYDSDEGMQAHHELFRLHTDAYLNLTLTRERTSQGDLLANSEDNSYQSFYRSLIEIIDIINAHRYLNPLTIHFVLDWKLMSRLATWCFDGAHHRALIDLLSDISVMSVYDIDSLKGKSIEEVFLFLLYNYRFGVLRKVCHITRKNILDLLENKSLQVICHIFSTHTKTIVASSL